MLGTESAVVCYNISVCLERDQNGDEIVRTIEITAKTLKLLTEFFRILVA